MAADSATDPAIALASEASAPVVPAEPAVAVQAPIAKATTPRKVKAAPALPVTKPAKPVAPAVAVKARKPKVAAAKPLANKPAPVKPAPIKAEPKAIAPKPKPQIKRTTSPKAAPSPRPLPLSKDSTMATTFDFAGMFKTAFADFQGKAKTAYDKGSSAITEANDFAKGNVEAMVESGKILASGLQELGTTMVTDSRSAFDTLTAEMKELAAVKSPTEFFQVQSALLRKHFDTAVAQTSKSTEAMLKLANDTMSPISNRVTLAVEKVSKVA